jgi:hypothetical protein
MFFQISDFTFIPMWSPRVCVQRSNNTDKWLSVFKQVQFSEDNDLWHEPEEAAVIDIVQSSNLIIVLAVAAFP